MKLRLRIRVFIFGILLASFLAAGPAEAARVDLNSVLNAGFSDNMPNSYLYIKSLESGTYAYQWDFGAGRLPWENRDDLVADLTDNVLDNAGQDTPIGDWRVESGGDPFHAPSEVIWKRLSLNAGTYVLRLTDDSGAYNLSDYTWPNETPGSAWNAYVQIFADYGGTGSDSFNFGEAPAFTKPTEAEALDFYRSNVDGKQIQLARAAEVYFYINDTNSVDNAGSVSLQIQPVPVPAAAYLLGSALIALVVMRRRMRNKI
ncbi:MAG TPA: VPLPA-CTERM sorting domain-containing protein [Desulfobacterales bacterium]